MTTPEEIARIAKGLTKAQRDEVKRGTFSGDNPITTARALMRKDLMHLRIDSPNGRCGFIECTPLGLAVRTYLMENPQ